DIAKTRSVTAAIVKALFRLSEATAASTTETMNRASPDREYVSGSTPAHASAHATASHAGPRREANISTAALPQSVRKRAVIFGSANVMFIRLATAGLGVQMVQPAVKRIAPSAATMRPEASNAIQARRWSSSV